MSLLREEATGMELVVLMLALVLLVGVSGPATAVVIALLSRPASTHPVTRRST